MNFGDVSYEIRILSRSIQKTYTLRKVKNRGLLFLLSWEPKLSENQNYLISWSTFACSRMLFCIGLKLSFWSFKPTFLRMQFSLVATFFYLLLVICLNWNFNLKLSHEFLTFISFNIWRKKCKSIRSSHLELVTWHFGSQMVFPNI